MLGSLGWQELVIVLIIVVIIFGAGRLPEIGGAVGKSIKEFRAQSSDETDDELEAGTTNTNLSQSTTTTTQEVKPNVQREVRADEV